MVEWHLKSALDRQVHLDRPCEQMGKVLRARSDHLCTEQASAAVLAVNSQKSPVQAHDPCPALVVERGLSDRKPLLAIFDELAMGCADKRYLGIGEDHRDRRASGSAVAVGKSSGVLSRDPALVGGLVQQRELEGGIACDEDIARPHAPESGS